jgi:hypothetical protein
MEELKQKLEMQEPNDASLLFGVIGPPAAWALHLSLLYPLVPFVCRTGGTILLYIIAFVLIGVIAFAGFVSWRSWKSIGNERQRRMLDGLSAERQGFMAFLGMLSAGFFIFASILGTLPIFFLQPCLVAGQHT